MGKGFVLATLNFFGIDSDQIDSLSLREIKRLAKEGYANYLYKIHPDRGGKGYLFRNQNYNRSGGRKVYVGQIKRMFERISTLKHKPMTLANCEQVLRISKGYKTTEDVDLGLNGFA